MSDNFSLEDLGLENSPEPDVAKKVFKEVKAKFDAVNENLDSIKSAHEQLKKLVDERDGNLPEVKAQIAKLSEDITVRQAAIDKKADEVHDRMDAVEIAMKRPGGYVPGDEGNKEYAEAKQFLIERLASSQKGADFNKLSSIEPNIGELREYKKAFQAFLRRPGDERSLFPEEAKAMSVGIDPDGGYTVTPFMSARILERIREIDPIRSLAGGETITTNAIEFMVDRDEAASGWETETVTGAETATPEIGKRRIVVHNAYARPRATQQLLEDSGINVEAWLASKVGERFARTEGAAFVTGTGIGQPRGFLTYPSGTAWGQIEQVAMGAAAALTADGFIDVKYSLIEEYMNRGTWLMNRSTVAAAMQLKDGTGAYIWKPALIASDPTSTILGSPVRMSTTMPSVAANALAVVYADFSQAYLIVDRLGITIQRDPYTVKPFVEFYTRKRVGGDVMQFDAIKIGIISV